MYCDMIQHWPASEFKGTKSVLNALLHSPHVVLATPGPNQSRGVIGQSVFNLLLFCFSYFFVFVLESCVARRCDCRSFGDILAQVMCDAHN